MCIIMLFNSSCLLRHLEHACTYFSIIFVDILVVCHLHQAMAQVVVWEDEETRLQVTVNFFQILKEKKRTSAGHFHNVDAKSI